MTHPVQRVLIVGGGFSGMSAAIELRKRGVAVDLAEIDAGWRSYGAGISLGGATLRAFRTLGVLDEFVRRGSAHDNVDLHTSGGHHIATLPTPRLAGPDVPGGGAIMRPVLAEILAEATRASGTTVRLGCTFASFTQDADGVDVTFTDGATGRYGLVIGADGLYSAMRDALFPGAAGPKYTGQGVWRAVLPRPAYIDHAMMWLGPKIKAGVAPVSDTEMYLYVTEDRAERTYVDPAQFLPLLRDLLAPFDVPALQAIRARLAEDSQVIYRPLEGLLLPRPWHRGRVVLIGDTVHATTPHMASGACIGIEDAIVLAEELERHADIDTALDAFEERRWERCRMVVENSGRLGEIEITGGDKAEHGRIMRETLVALAQAI
ncbi:FAD-dependent oxidoreductase [Pseudoduganella sp. SL102]|uniref:FAD-dependent oxidoreductase n=1 Tax=Pseudoduganella sp. SL102 TaxID=2995154 RepID=UPI00248D0F9E|nr:FAD-dependent oxidoreductase [Pseudoduganella sp. SL102]WBS05584.1 FAD-dependent oxidoreductase [Pseudoduganella sp. SL102]